MSNSFFNNTNIINQSAIILTQTLIKIHVICIEILHLSACEIKNMLTTFFLLFLKEL